MSIYTDYANGKISLSLPLVAKGYGQSGGACACCQRPLKRFPIYNGDQCLKCYIRNGKVENGQPGQGVLSTRS